MNEIWKNVIDYEGIYQISNLGNLKNIKTNKILKVNNKKEKYLNVSLYKNGKQKTFYIHRLIALIFIPNPHKLPMINHIDGNKQNNDILNLEWCTNRENTSHYYSNKSNKLRGAFYIKETNRWKSIIIVNNKRINLGHYLTEIDAHNAYVKYLTENNLK